ncbi:MAG TPA: hypothetical protein VGN87_16385 [Paenibacillus sp.]
MGNFNILIFEGTQGDRRYANQTDSKISLKEYSKANKSVGTVLTLIKVDFL